MPVKYFFLLICLGLLLISEAAFATPNNSDSKSYAFVDVNLIPIEPAGLLSHQTVLVKDGLITAIGPVAQIKVPPEYHVLTLSGKHLLPGFSDMHVHLAQERDLLTYLRHGITQIRNMGDTKWWGKLAGFPHVPALRDHVRSGQLIGPDIFACGAFLDGDPAQSSITTAISNPEQARQAVKQSKQDGFDCVKVYNRLSRINFEAIVKEAWLKEIPVMGHVPFDVGIDGALAARMKTIEHLNAYVNNFAGVYRIPPERWVDYAERTRQAGVYNCPTLVMWEQHPPYQNYAALKADPRYADLPEYLKIFWEFSVAELFDVPYPDKHHYPQDLLAMSKPMVKALYDGGAKLLIGTDANLTGVFPGRTALREMELFAEAGIDNQGILEAATLNASRVLGKEDRAGSLIVGKDAQFVVLDANPLADIKAIYGTVGVMTQGHWLTIQALDQLLKK